MIISNIGTASYKLPKRLAKLLLPLSKNQYTIILVCVKGIYFTFDGKTYVPTNGLAMGSPICPVLSGIFMAELENNLIHTIRRWHDLFDQK